VTYKIAPGATAYVGYAEANRAPTPAELSCASPQAPCSLTNFFVGDPNLKQVVARTIELGLRGQSGQWSWHAGIFRTDSDDDIAFVASPTIGRDFFENVGTTRRQGVETGIQLRAGRFRAFADYAFTDATYRNTLIVDGGANPQADANGLLTVRPGDHLPGVPQHVIKFGVDFDVTPAWTISLSGHAASGQYLLGDPSNLNAKTDAYAVLNLGTAYHVTERVELFGLIQNLTDARYASFGAFSPVGQSVPLVEAPGASNPRSLSLGAPLGVFGGFRIAF
jgi:outer membrane receptor protein involved in Fe transport